MKDEFLMDCFLIYIESSIAKKIDTNSILNEFYDIKEQQIKL